MLGFIRKFQRSVFIVVAGVIIATFSLFGVQKSQKSPKVINENRVIGHGVDGSKIMQEEVSLLTRFIISDCNDFQLLQKGRMPNFFNSGVIRKDILSSGIGKMLINSYFNELKGELKQRVDRHRRFRPYEHPSAPFISLQALYGQLIPKQKDNLDRFIHSESSEDMEAFSLLIDLYLGESSLPEHLVRQYLLMQQNAYSWIPKDPNLERARLSLFQCDSLHDWFGDQFVELCAQFINNSALIAKQKGYKITPQEAKVALMRNGYDALKREKPSETISKEEVGTLFAQQLRSLDMDEKEAVECWQKVMLFERLFDDVGSATFLDSHLYKTFYGFASKSAELDLYRLPKALEISDFFSLAQLQFYLTAVSHVGQSLDLPKNFKKAELIEKTFPELVETRFLIEIAEVKLSDLALNVPIKMMWEWQVQPENFLNLEKKFSELSLKKGDKGDDFFGALEGLEPNLRAKVDLHSREEIAKTRGDWIQEGLNQAPFKQRELSFSLLATNPLTQDKSESIALKALLEKAAFKNVLEENKEALEAREALHLCFFEGDTYYRMHLLDRDVEKSVLTFEEAANRGILEKIAINKLQEEYEAVKEKGGSPFKREDNTFKPFEEVRDLVAEQMLGGLLEKIDAFCDQSKIPTTVERKSALDSFYPYYRFYPFLQAARHDIRTQQDTSPFLQKTEREEKEGVLTKKAPLSEQWTFEKSSEIFKNHDKSPYFNSEIFSMVEKSWSAIEQKNSSSHLYFYKLNTKSGPSGDFSKEVEEGKEMLSKEAKCFYMTEVLNLLKEKQAIHLSKKTDQDMEGA